MGLEMCNLPCLGLPRKAHGLIISFQNFETLAFPNGAPVCVCVSGRAAQVPRSRAQVADLDAWGRGWRCPTVGSLCAQQAAPSAPGIHSCRPVCTRASCAPEARGRGGGRGAPRNACSFEGRAVPADFVDLAPWRAPALEGAREQAPGAGGVGVGSEGIHVHLN